ncbi:MAG: sugar kinase [Spirochaetaceae bacterium]|nr:MAG: sugar kinase [Spirochaetaceae bacterium]
MGKTVLKLPENKKHALMTATSMGIRLTPPDRQPMHTATTLEMQVTSAETNVVTIAASLGLPVKVLTKFVQGSPISRLIKNNLASRQIEVEGPEIEQGGPWGYRHQINMADSGLGLRGPRVHNDRAGEVGRTMSVEDFDLDRIFRQEGVRILHLSGLVAALSPDTGRFCTELARAAQASGTLVSFDLNHRASFWEGREEELHRIFTEIAAASDILVGNEEDFQLCLGVRGPEPGGSDVGAKIDAFSGMIAEVRKQFPRAQLCATTLREVISADMHLWGAVLVAQGETHLVQPREIPVIDRIGGGDGFVGGLLYGLLREWSAEDSLHFGWATGALAVTVLTDYAQPADEEQVWSIWKGNARVKR